MREFLGYMRKYITIISVIAAVLLAGCAVLLIISPHVFENLLRYSLAALCIFAAFHICTVIIRYLVIRRKGRPVYSHGQDN